MTSNRITQKQLESLVNHINKVSGTPTEPYTRQEDGTYKANIGNYHLDYAYGGVKLVKMTNENGGITAVSSGGYGTKRELWNQLHTLLNWLYSQEDNK